MKLLEEGSLLDGFTIGPCLHAGGMAHIYRVTYADGSPDPGFAMVMKVPRMAAGDGAENIVGFEVECQLLQVLTGPHVPRFVAAGDLGRMPYLVMEYVQGHTLQHWLDDGQPPPTLEQITQWGAAIARAVHALHQQNAVHQDLKPANVLLRDDGSAVLLDFGLSHHAHYPDLLAEELRNAIGSAAWMAPEQVVGVRGDARSDVFAMGVMLYQLCTGRLPFGSPQTQAGLRQRLWAAPVPPRQRRPELPAWLQEIVLRCLEPEADLRYSSGAHLAFDLAHADQVPLTERSERLRGPGAWQRIRQWLKAQGQEYQPSAIPARQIEAVPIVMVAVPPEEKSDAVLYSLRQAAARCLGSRPGARLAVVTVIAEQSGHAADDAHSETGLQRRHLIALRHWAAPLDQGEQRASFHVLESGDVAQALLDYAEGNHVSVLVMGAATHGLKTQRFIATVPIKVAMHAPCTVMLVKAALPFTHLSDNPPSIQ